MPFLQHCGEQLVADPRLILWKNEVPYGDASRGLDAVEADHLEARAVHEDRHRIETADADEVCAVLDQRDEPIAFGLGLSLARDVAGDFRRSDHVAVVVLDRRDAQRYHHAAAVGSHALRLEVLDAPTLLQRRDDSVFLCEALRRNHERDVAADGFGSRVAEQALSSRIPALDDAVEPLADDRDLRGLYDRCEPARRQQLALLLALDRASAP